MISVLKDNIESKEDAKESEHYFISAYGDRSINNNKPILIDMKEYQRNYLKEYNKRKKSGEYNNYYTTDLFKLENCVFTRLHSTFVQNVGLVAHPRYPGKNAPKLVKTSLDYAL